MKSTLSRNMQLFCFLVLVVISFLTQKSLGGDGGERFQNLQWLFRDQLQPTPSGYSLVGPFFSTPLYLVGRLFGDLSLVRYFNFFIALTFTFVRRKIVLKNTPSAEKNWIFEVLLWGASMVPHHLQWFYGEVFSACSAWLAIEIWARTATEEVSRKNLSSQNTWLAMPLLALSIANQPATLVAAAFSGFAFRKNKKIILSGVIAVVSACCLILLENTLRRGSPFETGYGENHGIKTLLPYSGLSGFSYPFFLGLFSHLFSFGRGILFFIPPLFLLCSSELRNKLTLTQKGALCYGFGLLLFYSKWWAWYSGWFWGPRFFLFLSIFGADFLSRSVVLRELVFSRVLLAGVSLTSFWVGFCGIFLGQNKLDACLQNGYQIEFLCWYVPEFSSLFRWMSFSEFAEIPATAGILFVVLVAVFFASLSQIFFSKKNPSFSK